MKEKSSRLQPEKYKHIPQRTCVACRQVKSKRELVRLVCSEETVEVDPAGKKPGRGAYLCPVKRCWETGLKSGRIEHALRTTLSDKVREELLRKSGVFDNVTGLKE